MPYYDYQCECGEVTEIFKRMNDESIPEHCGKPMKRIYAAHQIMPDIRPYRTVAADKETGKRINIMSRKQHREFLRRNDYEEVGNG